MSGRLLGVTLTNTHTETPKPPLTVIIALKLSLSAHYRPVVQLHVFWVPQIVSEKREKLQGFVPSGKGDGKYWAPLSKFICQHASWTKSFCDGWRTVRERTIAAWGQAVEEALENDGERNHIEMGRYWGRRLGHWAAYWCWGLRWEWGQKDTEAVFVGVLRRLSGLLWCWFKVPQMGEFEATAVSQYLI